MKPRYWLTGATTFMLAATGLVTAPTPAVATADTARPDSAAAASLPSSFQWTSSGPLIAPKSDATHALQAVKDPSVVNYNGKWYVFASTTNSAGGYSMLETSFTNWSQAGSATQHYLDQTPIGTGYKTAPQVFYFAPQKKWYLVYQTGANAAYSTNSDIANPAGWSAPHSFYTSMPAIIRQNIGSGVWVDMWVICDSANCYLFSMDDNGHLYRSQSTLANFPNGFGNGGNTVIAAQNANRHDFFEADNVYKVAGANAYLLIVEALGSGGHRYFRSYTSSSLTGSWSPLTATQSNPFAATGNVTFSGTPWTQDISSGEAIRTNYDQTPTINPCHMQYVYQGVAPGTGQPYNKLPWRIGLLTQTNSTC